MAKLEVDGKGAYIYPRMNKTVKRKWLKALRDGSFDQSEGCLIDVYGSQGEAAYCCLGVLMCVLHPDLEGDYNAIKKRGEDHSNSMPSNRILKEAGVHRMAAGDLATLNDDGLSFKKIAQWIEKRL